MIYFSLSKEIEAKKILSSINNLLKTIDNEEEAKNSILVIKIEKVAKTIEQEETQVLKLGP